MAALGQQRHLAIVSFDRQLGDLGVLRGVILGFSEEARTRGFPSPSLDGFGFIVSTTNYNRNGQVVQSVTLFWFFLSGLECPLSGA